MASKARGTEFWSAVVAEAETSGVPHGEVAAKYGVSTATLKYHLYQSRKKQGATKKSPEVLPVRLKGAEQRLFEVELGSGVRLRFAEGCDPVYVAAVIAKLR